TARASPSRPRRGARPRRTAARCERSKRPRARTPRAGTRGARVALARGRRPHTRRPRLVPRARPRARRALRRRGRGTRGPARAGSRAGARRAGGRGQYQNGEVSVTDDGGEADLDLGHYERFTSGRVTRDHNVTTGKVYFSVIQKERRGDYLGRTVQVIPHITDEIKASIRRVSRDTDVVIVEVGGTVGDIEGLPFLEAIRQFKKDVGRENVIYVHVTLVPFIQAA